MTHEVSWPGWEVVEKIGTGSFGSVYRIRREILGEEEFAALKVISIPHTSDELEELQSQGYDDATITTHFQRYLEDIVREYSLMRRMKGNTNVVYCDDIRYIQKPDGFGWTIYIKMELLNPLMKNLHRVNSEEQVLRLAKDLCNALRLCREYNIIHRDIKPQNVFISDTGNFKLGDFGIAKTVEKTARGTKIGTYRYMAPEVFQNEPYGHNADIYSLGLLLYWLLNEKRGPFLPSPPQIPTANMEDEAMMRRFRGDPLPAPAHGSPELVNVVLRACAADPTVRYQTAEEMLADLQRIVPSTAPFAAVPVASVAADDRTVSSFGQPAPMNEDADGTVSIFGRAPVTPPSPPTPTPAPAPKEKKKKGFLPFLLIGLALVAVILAIVLLPSLLGGEEPDPTTPADPTIAPTLVPTDPNAAPTDPTAAPTDPTAAPTDPTAAPTDPTLSPTDPPVPTTPTEAPNTPVNVPNVTGRSRQAATDALLAAGLQVRIQEEYSASVTAGTVIRQSPAADTACAAGTEVTLVVSLGADTVRSIQVKSMPTHVHYLTGDVLDLTGLTLEATYASGKKQTLTSGFNCNPMSLTGDGKKTILVSYGELSASFTVEIFGNLLASGSCGIDARWALQNNGRLTVFGTGEMDPSAAGYASGVRPWGDYLDKITAVDIKDGITSIAHCAFFECANLKTVTMTDSVVKFQGSWQFADCASLETIRMSKNLTGKIGEATFWKCAALKEITIPEGVTEIVQMAFMGCSSLKTVTVPKNVTAIGLSAFYGTDAMDTITILNPDCAIHSSGPRALGGHEGTVIRGCAGSTAQAYAEEYPTIYVFETIK